METIRITHDRYNRKLATIFIGSESQVEIDNSDYYMAILVVDTKTGKVMDRLKKIARSLSDKKVFTIAIFITDHYDWTFDNSLIFGISTWTTTTTTKEAENIVDDINALITSDAPVALDLADIKTILYKNEGRRFYYGVGTSNDNNLKTAIDSAVDKAKGTGMDVYECSKYLIAFNCKSGLSKEKMHELTTLIDDLSDKHKGNFEFKWGLLPPADKDANSLKFILIAAH